MTDGRRLRVVVVMPPVVRLPASDALALLPTVTMTLDALAATGQVDVSACFRSAAGSAQLQRNGIEHRFEASDRDLVRSVRHLEPDVVHVHGLGFVSLLVRLCRSLDRRVAIVVQHHGEPPGPWRNRLAHRLVRRRVAAHLFTGAHNGQAEPFRAAGIVGPHSRVVDVLEAASTLPVAPASDATDVQLPGSPAVLWVGRLILDKDPLAAVDAIAASVPLLPHVQLHMLTTDTSMAGAVVARAVAAGIGERVHLHPRVAPGQMHRWYQRADVLLSTSRREGSNYSLIEALTHGCPPAVSDIASHRSITRDLMPRFACGDAAGAAAIVAGAAALDRSTVRAYCDAHLTWPVVARQLVDVYAEVASS